MYDLQSVCVDQEREVSQVDLIGWLFSLGKRPLKRPLPNQTLVRMCKNLRRATARLPRLRIGEAERTELSVFLEAATRNAEQRLRTRFRPLISRSLERSDLRPKNLPEHVSFDRMTEELLDLVVERNFLTMGDIRDAASRSDLRQPDLSSPHEWIQGDRVLKANRRFAVSLDGIHHRGEVYLRFLQRMSHLAFGTRTGRWFTKFVALPYGGAFGALVTIEELLGLVGVHLELKHLTYVLTLGAFFLLLLHSVEFRRLVMSATHGLWRGVRQVLVDVPAWFLDRPFVRAILASAVFDVVRRIVIMPLLCAGLAFAVVYAFDRDRQVASGIAAVVYGVIAIFLGTRVGRDVEEIVSDAALRGWQRIQVDFLPGLIRFIMDVSDAFLEAVERVLYAVDERLRFRSGQGRATFWAKAVLGFFWATATYLIRIFINLLVEPTINPVKHFPTVTVAAKMILPEVKHIAETIAHRLSFLGPLAASAIGWSMVGFLPGLAGFFVWELKENWRLFEANRPKSLRPTMIGHHGETMRRLLIPGFHSGTIPKHFTKLRRSLGEAHRTGDGRAARKAKEALHQVEFSIHHFVERGLLAFLVESHRFPEGEISLADVNLATNRVRLALGSIASPDAPLILVFENDNGRLLGKVENWGWAESLVDDRRDVLNASLAGCLVRAGVDGVVGVDSRLLGTQRLSRPVTTDSTVIHELPAPTINWSDWVDYWSRQAVPRIEGSATAIPD